MPSLPWLSAPSQFPPTHTALEHPAGLLAASTQVDADWLQEAYPRGIFPWYSAGEPVLWWSTAPRTVLYTAQFKWHRSLCKTLRQLQADPSHRITLNHAFADVIAACASTPRPGQDGTWLSPTLMQAYLALHQRGHAHSVEHWHGNKLVGGLYCVAFGAMVYGESMFSLEPNASKVALASLVHWLHQQGVRLVDCQQATPHLLSLGAVLLPRPVFEMEMQQALGHTGPNWQAQCIGPFVPPAPNTALEPP